MKFETFVLLQGTLWTLSSCLNFNISNLSNCVDIPLQYETEAEVEVCDIIYERNTLGFVDTLHGKFVVHFLRNHEQTEMVLTIFKCPAGSVGTCDENSSDFVESLNCERFQNDKTGPWFMFAPAVDQKNPCAESKGKFDIIGATIKGEYLEKYMTIEEGHYRIRMLHHLPGKSLDLKFLRGCIELDFDIVS